MKSRWQLKWSEEKCQHLFLQLVKGVKVQNCHTRTCTSKELGNLNVVFFRRQHADDYRGEANFKGHLRGCVCSDLETVIWLI